MSYNLDFGVFKEFETAEVDLQLHFLLGDVDGQSHFFLLVLQPHLLDVATEDELARVFVRSPSLLQAFELPALEVLAFAAQAFEVQPFVDLVADLDAPTFEALLFVVFVVDFAPRAFEVQAFDALLLVIFVFAIT